MNEQRPVEEKSVYKFKLLMITIRIFVTVCTHAQ